MTALRLVRGPETGSADLLDEWAEWMTAAGSSAKTISTRVTGIRALAAHAGQPDLTAFTPAQVVSWLAGCRSPWTRSTYATTARQWHRWLVEQGHRADDPMTRVPNPRQPRGVPRPATEDALQDALEVAGRRARAYLLLAAYEGLRVHEIAKVRGEDFADGWLWVVGKGGDREAVPVHPFVERLRTGWPDRGWWFPSSVGNPTVGHVSANAVSRTVADTFRRAGHQVTAHQLRHRFGTQVQRTTRDLRVTQELMRHRSIQSTQVYTRVAGSAKVAAVHRLT